MNAVKSVFYNDGKSDLFALVASEKDHPVLDLIVFDKNGSSGRFNDVPRRDEADYGEEGGGHTWHA